MNTPENWETFATIHPESERAASWREVFGGDRAPIKSILPHRAGLPGKPDALVYEMDLGALTPEMRERLVKSIAKRFDIDPAFVEFDLDRLGCPVLADDVVVSTTNVGLLLPDYLGDLDDDRLPFDEESEEDEWDERAEDL